MRRDRIQLAPDVPGLGALGVAGVEELLDTSRLPHERAVELAAGGGCDLLRYPRPGSAGLGWLHLRRWSHGALLTLLRARLTAPRSTSLAERAWNVACHLRAHGVGTAELVAVGARGGGLYSRRSFLVTRELDGYETLRRWLAEDLAPATRRRGAAAVGHTLAKLLRSGVELPHLDDRTLHLSIEAEDADDHGGTGCLAESGGPERNRMSSIVVTALDDARLHEGRLEERALALLQRLHGATEPSQAVGARLRLRVLVLTTRGAGIGKEGRRRILRGMGG